MEMNLLTKTGLITATSLGLIACGGANNGGNTPDNTPAAKAPATKEALQAAALEQSQRSLTVLSLMSAATGEMAYKSEYIKNKGGFAHNYKAEVEFNRYIKNGIEVTGKGEFATQFTVGEKGDHSNNPSTDKIEGNFSYNFAVTADDRNDASGPATVKANYSCNLSGASNIGYEANCGAGEVYKLVGLTYTPKVPTMGAEISFNGMIKDIPGGDVTVKGENLKPCYGTNGFFEKGTLTIKRNSNQQDVTMLKFESCSKFTAKYKDNGLLEEYILPVTNSK